MFLFAFLPLALLGVTLTSGLLRNAIILSSSLVFYYWASGWLVLLLISSFLFNWGWARFINRYRERRWLVLGITINLGVLVYFKYTYFIAGVVDEVLGTSASVVFSHILLPIGISFFTFQGISYLIDVWRKSALPERSVIRFGAYLTFFPQLIAGPIVRYADVAADFESPKRDLELVSSGCVRFAHGLAKKVIIADTAGAVADVCFAQANGDLLAGVAWLGAIAYTLQIYFDFSGYSDMAIGIGRICGVRIPENFRHPYSSSTITEFWRRWHVSLSSWFRDYLYIPLGGSRVSSPAIYRNLLLVFLATGFWHGAAWSFIAWGLYHGTFLILERLAFSGRAGNVRSLAMRYVYLLPAVIVGWVLFRSDSITDAWYHVNAMVGVMDSGAWQLPTEVRDVLTPLSTLALVIGSSTFFMRRKHSVGEMICRSTGVSAEWTKLGYVAVAMTASAVFALAQDFSPFLYFRF
ncbi:MAG: MBOAT family protein [Lysobacterales bacterium]